MRLAYCVVGVIVAISLFLGAVLAGWYFPGGQNVKWVLAIVTVAIVAALWFIPDRYIATEVSLLFANAYLGVCTLALAGVSLL